MLVDLGYGRFFGDFGIPDFVILDIRTHLRLLVKER
jgi:hypothetical protein